jgi:N6-adenosine-specific RNA methylase IME4
VITPDAQLVAGQRRLKACEKIGWSEVPVRVVDIDAIVRGEFAENTHRKSFTLSEVVAIKRALEPIERAAAKERQGTRTDKLVGNFPTSKQRALDKVAKVVGKDRTTISKAEAVVAAAEAEPEKFGHLLARMDQTGRVNGPYRRLRNTQQAELIRAEPPPLPSRGPYRVAVCDVPWPYNPADPDPSCRGSWPYPGMAIDEMCALPIGKLMHTDAILWFWVTNFHLRLAYRVLDAWGFHETPTLLTWAKSRAGQGHWLLGQTEHAILAVRGKPVITRTTQTTLLHAPVRGHSVKPKEFYDLVEKMCPAPRYVDLFSRRQHSARWDCWGDEAPKTDDGEAAS